MGFKMQYDNECDNDSDDAPLIAALAQEYEWINGTHRPEAPPQWIVYRAELAKRDAHMTAAV